METSSSSPGPLALMHQEAPTTAVSLTRGRSPAGPGGQAAWNPRGAGGRTPGLCPPAPAKRHVHPSPESYRKAIFQELNQEESQAPISAGAFPSVQVRWGPSGVREKADSTHPTTGVPASGARHRGVQVTKAAPVGRH